MLQIHRILEKQNHLKNLTHLLQVLLFKDSSPDYFANVRFFMGGTALRAVGLIIYPLNKEKMHGKAAVPP
jgi:hypothetical protein